MTTLKKKSIREEVWLRNCGEVFSRPCITSWCSNRITVFDFHVGHNIPSSRGGLNTFDNLKPICARCNYAMGNRYTIDEWQSIMNVGFQSDNKPNQAETTAPELYSSSVLITDAVDDHTKSYSHVTTRIEQADVQNEQADVQNEQADVQNEQADVQNEQADVQNEQADVQNEHVDVQIGGVDVQIGGGGADVWPTM